MEVVTHLADLPDHLARLPRPLGLVPTMGALHEGHLSLARVAKRGCRSVVASIFVNPLQFGPLEDFERYPRAMANDLGLLESLGVDLAFTPHAVELTPPGRLTTVSVARLTDRFEGMSRPGHFDGVTTIVSKLLNLVRPDRAFFGEKDFQQLMVIRRMVKDLNLQVSIVGCPIIRDPDGLALSSRNIFLSPEERRSAASLYEALVEAAADWGRDADAARLIMERKISSAPGVRLDYAEVVDPETLVQLEGVVEGPAQALVAADIGDTRLIDNIRLEPHPRPQAAKR